MPRSTRYCQAIATLALATFVASAAFAAPATWQSVNVTLHEQQAEGSTLIVTGQLEPTTPLPAEVELAVPAGSELLWIGEILGGAPENDLALQYTKSASPVGDVYLVTLTKARIAQVEVAGPAVSSYDGTAYRTSLTWAPSQDVASVTISAAVPVGSRIASEAPDAALIPATGGSYYSKTVTDVKAGTPVELTFSYALQTAGGAGADATGPTQGGDAASAIVAAIVLLLAAFVVVMGLRRRAASQAPSGAGRRSGEGTAVEGAVEDVDDGAEEPGGDTAGSAERFRLRGVHIVALGFVAIAIAVAMYAQRPTKAVFVDGVLAKDFGSTSSCQFTSYPLTAMKGVDLEASGGQLIDALEGKPGLGKVTVRLEPPSIDVGWCESSMTEDELRAALEGAGVATLGEARTTSSDVVTGTVAPAP